MFYFTGKKLDDETGLYYYGGRYYDSSLGRFITPDTIVQSPGGNPQTFNRYSYCGNNPVNFIDPTGHWFWAAIVAIVKAAASYAAAHPLITGAVVGGLTGGVNAAVQGTNVFQGIAIGAGIGWATGGITSFIPGGGTFSQNLLLNMGYHSVRGAAIGSVLGGGINSAFGGEFGDGARMGAISGGIGGAIGGFTSSEQFGNWVEHDKFMTNSRYSAYRSNRLAFEEIAYGTNEYAGSAGLAASGDLNGYRHTALTFGDSEGSITSGWGKYPASNFKDSGMDFIFGATRPGEINNEWGTGFFTGRAGVTAKLFPATNAQLQAGSQYVSGSAGIQALKTNCADWALRGFRQMGYSHPPMRTFTHTDPAKVQAWINTYGN